MLRQTFTRLQLLTAAYSCLQRLQPLTAAYSRLQPTYPELFQHFRRQQKGRYPSARIPERWESVFHSFSRRQESRRAGTSQSPGRGSMTERRTRLNTSPDSSSREYTGLRGRPGHRTHAAPAYIDYSCLQLLTAAYSHYSRLQPLYSRLQPGLSRLVCASCSTPRREWAQFLTQKRSPRTWCALSRAEQQWRAM